MATISAFFKIPERNTTVSREIVAGLTTFTTMSYIIVVNPAILRNAGIPVEAQTVATICAAIFGCVLMAFYANRPFAIAPYMGENAFIAFTVCQSLGYKWQTALAAIFIAGIVFIISSIHLLYVNTRLLPVELRPPMWRRLALVALALFYGFFLTMWVWSSIFGSS